MKTSILILIIMFFINSLYSQNRSKVEEYLNESKEDQDISVSKDTIRKQKTPGVGFSIDGKRGVNEEFLSDEFVKSLVQQGGASLGNDGDIEFDLLNPEKPTYDESVKLKDGEEYSDEEIAQFAQMADQYYEFKDFDEYNDYYYYYDTEALENFKEEDQSLNTSSFGFLSITKYVVAAIKKILPSQISYSLNPDFENAIDHFYGASVSKPKPSVSYNVAKAAGANGSLLNEAVNYYYGHKGQFSNNRFMAVLEFSKHSAKSRFYIINLKLNKVVAAYHVSHGSGSDKNNDGYATYFSNVPGSKASSLGVYKTGEIYKGKYGRSLRLHGLSPTNLNVYRRAVVIHPSPYVKEANVKPGRSWGCMAFDYKVSGDVINMLRNGALIYAKYVR
ncbi:MAG: murein L,D-transpeptidase catalytic domain family protein [Elusimicrobiota bacterium]